MARASFATFCCFSEMYSKKKWYIVKNSRLDYGRKWELTNERLNECNQFRIPEVWAKSVNFGELTMKSLFIQRYFPEGLRTMQSNVYCQSL